MAKTRLGFVFFQADKILKEYSLGSRVDGERIYSSVPDYEPLPELMKSNSGKNSNFAGHLWFNSHPTLVVSDRIWLLRDIGLSVEYSQQVWENGRFVNSSEDKNPYLHFGEFFTARFARFAEEEPLLAGFRLLVQLQAWSVRLHQFRENLHLQRLVESYEREDYDTPTSLPSALVTFERRSTLPNGEIASSFIRVSGGISLLASDVTMVHEENNDTREIRAIMHSPDVFTTVGELVNLDSWKKDQVGIVVQAARLR